MNAFLNSNSHEKAEEILKLLTFPGLISFSIALEPFDFYIIFVQKKNLKPFQAERPSLLIVGDIESVWSLLGR
jgi:hypothetical protein